MLRGIALVLVILGLFGGYWYYTYIYGTEDLALVVINQHQFHLEIARTKEEQTKGLANREKLFPSEGMIFVFDVPQASGFWMQDVKFPLDIIWVKNNMVVEYVSNAQPSPPASLTTYFPPREIDYALELPAGSIQQYGIDVGVEVRIDLEDRDTFPL